MILEALDDFMLKLLIVCACFSIIVEMSFASSDEDPSKLKTAWIEGFAILSAVACVSFVTAWSDFKKEGQFLKQQMLEENSKIVSKNSYLLNFSYIINFIKIFNLKIKYNYYP